MPQIAVFPRLCYGKTVCCFFCTSTWHVATSLPSVISLSDSNWTNLCVGTDKLSPGILCGLRRHSVLHACVTSLRGWSPSPRPPCSVGLLFVTSCLFPPCCQQISRTHFLKSNSGLELAPIHCVGLVSLHTATYTCPKIFSNFSKDMWKSKIYSCNNSINKADWVVWVVTGFAQTSVFQETTFTTYTDSLPWFPGDSFTKTIWLRNTGILKWIIFHRGVVFSASYLSESNTNELVLRAIRRSCAPDFSLILCYGQLEIILWKAMKL